MRNSTGFTIIELLISIGIIAILCAIAIPGYLGWLPNRHLQSSALDVQAAIGLAKHTAIKENANVVLEFDTASEKYVSFIDLDEDNLQDVGERTIRSKEMSPGINLNSTSIPANRLIFSSRGLANSSGNIELINQNGTSQVISVTLTGISRIN